MRLLFWKLHCNSSEVTKIKIIVGNLSELNNNNSLPHLQPFKLLPKTHNGSHIAIFLRLTATMMITINFVEYLICIRLLHLQVVVLVKCLCQFEMFWANSQPIPPNSPLAPARIIGLEKKKNYASFDLALLMVVFFHR